MAVLIEQIPDVFQKISEIKDFFGSLSQLELILFFICIFVFFFLIHKIINFISQAVLSGTAIILLVMALNYFLNFNLPFEFSDVAIYFIIGASLFVLYKIFSVGWKVLSIAAAPFQGIFDSLKGAAKGGEGKGVKVEEEEIEVVEKRKGKKGGKKEKSGKESGKEEEEESSLEPEFKEAHSGRRVNIVDKRERDDQRNPRKGKKDKLPEEERIDELLKKYDEEEGNKT